MKRCQNCKQEKTKSEFNKNVSMPDGLQGWCRSCQSVYNKGHAIAYQMARIARKKAQVNISKNEDHLTNEDIKIGFKVVATGNLKRMFDMGYVKRIRRDRQEALVTFDNGVAWIPFQNLKIVDRNVPEKKHG